MKNRGHYRSAPLGRSRLQMTEGSKFACTPVMPTLLRPGRARSDQMP